MNTMMNTYRITLKHGRPYIHMRWNRHQWSRCVMAALWTCLLTVATITSYDSYSVVKRLHAGTKDLKIACIHQPPTTNH